MRKETEQDRQSRRELYEKYKAAGKSVNAFSASIGMTYWKVKYAIKKCEFEDNPASGARSSFREIKIPKASEGGGYAITNSSSGRSLKIPHEFSIQEVRQLLELL